MKLIYSGKTKEFTSDVEEKIGVKLTKLGKLIEQRGEREAYMTHHVERHLHKTEIIVNVLDHSLVGEGADTDLGTSLCQAIEKLEKQVVRLKARWRDLHRDAKGTRAGKESWDSEEALPVNGNGKLARNGMNGHLASVVKPKIFRVNYEEDRKPMMVEEAMMEMEAGADYVVYRDANRSCVSVLVRRPDGNYDLIES